MNREYSPEMRERALRMLAETRPSHPTMMSAVRHVAGLLGMSPETLRLWQRRYEDAERGFREALARQYPEVAFLGWRSREEMADLVGDARLLAMPSRYPEPFGLVALEAMAAGLPVAEFAAASGILEHTFLDLEGGNA